MFFLQGLPILADSVGPLLRPKVCLRMMGHCWILPLLNIIFEQNCLTTVSQCPCLPLPLHSSHPKVLWPLSPGLAQLDALVDTSSFAVGILKDAATASQTVVNQWVPCSCFGKCCLGVLVKPLTLPLAHNLHRAEQASLFL